MVITLHKKDSFFIVVIKSIGLKEMSNSVILINVHLLIVIVFVEVEFDWYNNRFNTQIFSYIIHKWCLGCHICQKLTAVFVSNDVAYTPLEVGIGIGLDKGIYWTNTSLFVWFWGFVWDWWAVWVTLFISNWSWNKYRAITPLGSLWRTFYSDMLCKIWNR